MQLEPRVRRAVTIVAAWMAASSLVLAQAPSPGAPDVARGQSSFLDHCAVCHGDHGKGNGVAASSLRNRPTDLTKLSKPSGTFPAEHVEAVLKGQAPVTPHGTATMMMWGAFFSGEANGNPAVANQRIEDLVAFIKSIQAK